MSVTRSARTVSLAILGSRILGLVREQVLAGLFELLDGRPGVLDAAEMRRAVLEREQVMSTGLVVV